MAAARKRKRLSQKEKAFNAQIKKEMQEEGLLPPDKPKLNRKRFAKEVIAEYEKTTASYDDFLYLYKALWCMVGENMRIVTPEQVGVLKVLKIAVETKKFYEALRAEGKTEYTIGEYIEKVVAPIRDL